MGESLEHGREPGEKYPFERCVWQFVETNQERYDKALKFHVSSNTTSTFRPGTTDYTQEQIFVGKQLVAFKLTPKRVASGRNHDQFFTLERVDFGNPKRFL